MPDLTPIASEQQALRNFHTQAQIDVLTAAAFAVAGIPACECGRMTDGVVATCWPCQSGNTRGGFYRPAESEAPVGAAPVVYRARIADLERAVAYWRGRWQALAGEGAE